MVGVTVVVLEMLKDNLAMSEKPAQEVHNFVLNYLEAVVLNLYENCWPVS